MAAAVERKPQHLNALDQANAVRLRRAREGRLVRSLGSKAAQLHVALLLERPPWWLENAPLDVVLGWMPRYGKARIRRLMVTAFAPHVPRVNLPVRQLTERQRDAIVETLRGPQRVGGVVAKPKPPPAPPPALDPVVWRGCPSKPYRWTERGHLAEVGAMRTLCGETIGPDATEPSSETPPCARCVNVKRARGW